MKNQNPKWLRTAIVVVVLAMSSMGAFAQKVPSVQSYLAGLSPSNQQAITSLMNDAQPTAGVSASGINVFGSGNPTVLDLNINNYSNVNFNDARLANVQLIKIRLNSVADFSNVIDLAAASNLSQLSCIVLISSVNATTTQLNSVMLNVPSSVATCYSVSIPN